MSEENTIQDPLDKAAQMLHAMFQNHYIANVVPNMQQTRTFTALLAMGVMEFMQEQQEEQEEGA